MDSQCEIYAALCLEDAADRLQQWLASESPNGAPASTESLLLFCALRLRATKHHFWHSLEEFAETLYTPLQLLAPPAPPYSLSDEPEDSLAHREMGHRVRRFAEIYVTASARGRKVGSRTKQAEYPSLDFSHFLRLSDVGETFGTPLQTITGLAARPTILQILPEERDLLAALLR